MNNTAPESSLVGSILIDGGLLARVMDLVDPEDFEKDAHRVAFEACRSLAERKEGVDLVTVEHELSRTGRLERAGGAAYLAGLVDVVPDVENAETYARQVRETALSRRAALALRRGAEALEAGGAPEGILPGLEAALASLRPSSEATTFPWIDANRLREIRRILDETTIPTGIPSLDRATRRGGLPGGVVVSLVGPPGSCKSTLALQLALGRARQADKVVYAYTPDQGGMQPALRLADAGLEEEVGHRIYVADETASGVTLETFRDAVLRAGDAAAVVIDTPQTVATALEDDAERARIDLAMETALSLAQRLLVPVLVCHHANRAATAARRREDRNHPRSAGAGSGKIEHRSQALLFLERVDREDEKTEVDCEIVKLVDGSPGRRFRLVLDPLTWTLTEIDREAAAVEDEIRAEAAATDRRRRTTEKIVGLLRRHPDGLSGRAIEQAVPTKAADVRSALLDLQTRFLAYSEPRAGRGGGLVWKLAQSPGGAS